MRLVRLTSEYDLKQFDCGDNDLNEFLIDNALDFSEKRIANTFILEKDREVIAYFCILNDKISQQDVTNSQWKKIKKGFPDRKHFSSYPAIKIGRFAVSSSFKGQNLGSGLIAMLKDLLNGYPNYSAFRYLTVDAYMSAIVFYEKNGFKILSEKSIGDHTRLMFFDMMELE